MTQQSPQRRKPRNQARRAEGGEALSRTKRSMKLKKKDENHVHEETDHNHKDFEENLESQYHEKFKRRH